MTETETGALAELLPDFSGVVLITRDGRPVLREANGLADTSTGQPVTPESIFQLCSVSKQFTAASVLLLAQDGALDLHEPITHQLPEVPDSWSAITPHHLISNSSGFVHWQELSGFDAARSYTAPEVLGLLIEQPLLFASGTGWNYSSPGFLVAATIVERVSGETYRDFTTRRIFAPLGMTSTSVGVPVREAVRGHTKGGPADRPTFAKLIGAGDAWSTIDDLARYAAAFDAGELLGEQSRRLATTIQGLIPEELKETDGPLKDEGYGYGYVIGTLLGHRVRYHSGDNPGFRTFQLRVPDLDVSIVILSNRDETDLPQVGAAILTHVADIIQ
jgi:CubicO group peptidase (beta-lactamase class C family)